MPSRFPARWVSRILAVSSAAALLGGCTVSTPFRTVAGRPVNEATTPQVSGAPVVISLTHAVLQPGRRGPFDDHVRQLAKDLPAQPGLVGYSLRRELLGDEVWTMTVWQDDASRQRFVNSEAHRRAIEAGAPALRSVRFRRLEWPAGTPLPDWPRALALLDEESRGYAPR